MNKEEKLSNKEISERIVTGMGLVYDLFNEMNSFFRQLLESLQSSEMDIFPLKGNFVLPRPKKRKLRTAADDYLKTDMGFIGEIGGIEEEDTGEEEEDREAELEKKGISITRDSQFLAVRAVVYDAEKVKDGSFEPFVVGAVLSSLTRSPRGRILERTEGKAKDEQFQLSRRGHLFRCMGHLEPSLKKDKEISWLIPKYKLSAKVSGILSSPLMAFDSEEKFNSYTDGLITIAQNALKHENEL